MSGKNNERPQLRSALTHARQASETLVIAKLDRLSRNVTYIAQQMEAGVEFVACDLPAANRFTLLVMDALAEHERHHLLACKQGVCTQPADLPRNSLRSFGVVTCDEFDLDAHEAEERGFLRDVRTLIRKEIPIISGHPFVSTVPERAPRAQGPGRSSGGRSFGGNYSGGGSGRQGGNRQGGNSGGGNLRWDR